MVDSDGEDEAVEVGNGDPEGGQVDETEDINAINAPSLPTKEVDHQEIQRIIPSNPEHLEDSLPLRHLAHSNKGVPPICLDKDPRLEQGSRPHARGTHTPVIQFPAITPVGVDKGGPHESKLSLHTIDDGMGALYLTADTPHSYREAMRQDDAADWVKSISVKLENLCHRGMFIEVAESPDMHVHKG